MWFDIIKRELNVGLISDRHEMPVDEYLIQGPVRGLFASQGDKLYNEFWAWLNKNHERFDVLNVYMTGYGIARDAFLEALVKFNKGKVLESKKIYLFNYDQASRKYVKRRWN
jgi:hypothetical protein